MKCKRHQFAGVGNYALTSGGVGALVGLATAIRGGTASECAAAGALAGAGAAVYLGMFHGIISHITNRDVVKTVVVEKTASGVTVEAVVG